jgi:epoxyqueuosine reductase
MGNRIYGCDDCLAACPWNKFAKQASEAKLAARDDLDAPPLADLLTLDDAEFRAMFSGSPVKRIGPRPVPPQRADRGRQFGDAVAGRAAVRALLDDAVAAGARRGGVGAVAIA